MRSLCFIAFVLLAGCGYHQPISNLARAARSGDLAAIRALIANRADPNAPSGVNGWTPVMHAIHKNQAGAAYALIKAGADVNATSPNGETALMMAAGYGQTGVVRGLLKRGANPRLRSEGRWTALDFAVTGVADIDAFTLGKCQASTVRALHESAPDVRPSKSLLHWLAGMADGCPEIDRMLSASQ